MRPVVLTLAAIAMLIVPAARAADVDDLKAASDAFIEAINKQDISALLASYHDDFVSYGTNAVFPNDSKGQSKADRRHRLENLFAVRDHITITRINPQYRVVGTTGIVWGHFRSVVKLKDGPQETRTRRFLATWVKSGGKWVRLAVHMSAVPSGN